MKPEDITGIDSRGFRVHCNGCTCDYNEFTHHQWESGVMQATLRVVIQKPVFRLDENCTIHREDPK